MKKIFLILLSLFSVKITLAAELNYDETNYYVRLITPLYEHFVPIKKIYDQQSLEVLFNLEPVKYDITYNYNKSNNIDDFGIYSDKIELFNKIVYIIYNSNKTNLNYAFAQILIWDLINEFEVDITDEDGNSIDEYNSLYKNYLKMVNEYIINDKTNNNIQEKYDMNLWDTLNISYKNANLLLNKKITTALNVTDNNSAIEIKATNPGEYQLELMAKNENYVYTNGTNYYWLFNGDISNRYIKLNITGINLQIKEKIIGVNNRFGDARYSHGNYELFYDKKIKLNINDLNSNYIRKNASYILKDKTDNISFNQSDNIVFDVGDKDYVIEIEKVVINKKININIFDEFTYYIFLKSNNELYEIINKNTDLITLPYGVYYIYSKDCNYFKEIVIKDNINETLVINNLKKEKLDNQEDKIIENELDILDSKNKEAILDLNIISNPKTIDNINLYLILFLSSILSLIILKKLK